MDIVLTVIVGYMSYLVAKRIGVPACGMIGSMIGVGTLNVLFGRAYFPIEMKIFTQMVTGAFIGIQIYRKDLIGFKVLYKPCLLLLLILTLNTFIIGWMIHKVCGMDLLTALLACCAGGATDISLISIDMGADTSIVALMQVLRLVIVLLIFPIWIEIVTKKCENNQQDLKSKAVLTKPSNSLLNCFLKNEHRRMMFTLLIAILSGWLGQWTGIPAGTLIFSMFTIALMNCVCFPMYLPIKIKTLAQIFAGSLVGCTITRDTLINAPRLILPMIMLLLSYWCINIIFTVICKKWNYLDVKSSLFASCPGGASDMALIAGDLGADMAKIALIQVCRMIYIIAIMPLLIRLVVELIV